MLSPKLLEKEDGASKGMWVVSLLVATLQLFIEKVYGMEKPKIQKFSNDKHAFWLLYTGQKKGYKRLRESKEDVALQPKMKTKLEKELKKQKGQKVIREKMPCISPSWNILALIVLNN